jgi:hypothetical protein
LFAFFATELCCRFDQYAVEDRTIVIGEFDEAGLGNQAAKLDQLTRTFTALHLPLPRVMTRSLRQQPVAVCRRSTCRRLRRDQRESQLCAARGERTVSGA